MNEPQLIVPSCCLPESLKSSAWRTSDVVYLKLSITVFVHIIQNILGVPSCFSVWELNLVCKWSLLWQISLLGHRPPDVVHLLSLLYI